MTRAETLAEVEARLAAKLVDPKLAKSLLGGLGLALSIVREMQGKPDPFATP